ncbi:MAG: OmpA family protein [Ignavibacterium sp.]|nr:OmpA family protein [Ignavibacterium sp.]
MRNSNYGFWLSYIDTMTAFGAIFLFLFVFMFIRARTIDEKFEVLIKNWNASKDKLERLNAKPEIDTTFGGIKLTIAENILFKINSSEISDSGKILINELSKILAEFIRNNYKYKKAFRITIGGHTDVTGSDDINFPLSYKRAYNVAEIIKKEFSNWNLENENIVPIAYGSKYLRKDIDDPRDPRHRRITIVIQLLSSELLKTEKFNSIN